MHWTGVGLGTGLTLLFAYIWLFVGSTRPDAERQMNILFWLIVAFGSMTIVVGFEIRAIVRSAIRWRGETLSFATRNGPQTLLLSQAAAMRVQPLGRVIVTFDDGAIVKIDPYAQGAETLIEDITGRIEARRTS